MNTVLGHRVLRWLGHGPLGTPRVGVVSDISTVSKGTFPSSTIFVDPTGQTLRRVRSTDWTDFRTDRNTTGWIL